MKIIRLAKNVACWGTTRRWNHVCPVCNFSSKAGGLCPHDRTPMKCIGDRHRIGKMVDTKKRKKRK